MRIKNDLSIFLAILLFNAQPLWAGDISMTTYYPAPQAIHDRAILLGWSSLPGTCEVGTLVVYQIAGILYYCHDVAGVGTWSPLSNVWRMSGDNVFPVDTEPPDANAIGIGTSTPNFKLTLEGDAGILALGAFGSGAIVDYDFTGMDRSNNPDPPRFLWYPRKAAFYAVSDALQVTNDATIGNYSIAFGKNASASGIAAVANGETAIASGDYSVVAGGLTNTASKLYATVAGGQNSIASGEYSTASGLTATASANYSTVAGGYFTRAEAQYGTVQGGSWNSIRSVGDYSTIGGGDQNQVNNIGGGVGTTCNYATVGGGNGNAPSRGDYATIAGGWGNRVLGPYGFVGGGMGQNSVSGGFIIPAGVLGNHTVIGGGSSNHTYGDFAVVGGGYRNVASGDHAVIHGGYDNAVSGNFSVITGGYDYTLSGNYSVITPTGWYVSVASDYSFAAGTSLTLTNTADRTFAFGGSYSPVTPVTVSAPDSFIIGGPVAIGSNSLNIRTHPTGAISNIRGDATVDYWAITSSSAATPGDIFIIKANGTVGIGTPFPIAAKPLLFGPQANNAYLASTGNWTSTCSRKYKMNIEPLDSQEAIHTVMNLNPVTFNYKVDKNRTHVGFIAEDVPDLVATEDHKGLDTMNINAVLASVLKDHKNRIQKQEDVLDNLENELREFEAAIQKKK